MTQLYVRRYHCERTIDNHWNKRLHNDIMTSKCFTLMSQWAWWRLKSPALRLFTQPLIQAQIKENIKAPRHCLCEGNSLGTGEFPAQMANNAENVSIWWRHHVFAVTGSLWRDYAGNQWLSLIKGQYCAVSLSWYVQIFVAINRPRTEWRPIIVSTEMIQVFDSRTQRK